MTRTAKMPKVTKIKSSSAASRPKSVRQRRTRAPKSARSEPVFKLFGRGARVSPYLMLFERESTPASQSRRARPRAKSESIPVTGRGRDSVHIAISNHRLDLYHSPHLLDLSSRSGRERPSSHRPRSREQALPGEHYLNRFGLLALVDFGRSPLLMMSRHIWHRRRRYLPLTKRINISPRLPLEHAPTGWSDRQLAWHEVTFVSLLVQAWGWLGRLRHVVASLKDSLGSRRSVADEVVILAPVGSSPRWRRPHLFRFRPSLPVIRPRRAMQTKSRPVAPEVPLLLAYAPEQTRFRFTLIAKPLFAFILIAVIVASPLRLAIRWQDVKATKGEVLGDTEQALSMLQDARQSLASYDMASAEQSFSGARSYFESARGRLDSLSAVATNLATVIPVDNQLKSGVSVIDMGRHASAAGAYLLVGAQQLTATSTDRELTDRIRAFAVSRDQALIELYQARQAYDRINPDHLPTENRTQLTLAGEYLPEVIEGLELSRPLTNFLLTLLGDHSLRRYLFVFQNDNELRGSGGFMGSFALVDIQSGEVVSIDAPVGGTYDLRAGLKNRLLAPPALQLINARWEFQDSNWWPDWPTSAETIRDFYSETGGPSVDGVIAINSDWFGELLTVLGPVRLDDGTLITADNFELELQRAIELKATDKTAPKKVIGTLLPTIMDQILSADPDQLIKLTSALTVGLDRKDIQLYMREPAEQAVLTHYRWDGAITTAPLDYLMVTATNIGGGKTDGVINQEIRHTIAISADGSVTDTVEITRHHFGPIDDHFTTTPNRSYLRIYVPEGSTLLRASGFSPIPASTTLDATLEINPAIESEVEAEIDSDSGTKFYTESGKTVFANWLTTQPGGTTKAVVVYKLPGVVRWDRTESVDSFWEKLQARFMRQGPSAAYHLTIQKQSGSNDDQITTTMHYPASWALDVAQPSAKQEKGTATWQWPLTSDTEIMATFSQ